MGTNLRFRNIIFPIEEGTPFDEDEPVLGEITPRGDLVIYNYDHTVDDVALTLGYEPDDILYTVLEKSWDEVVGSGFGFRTDKGFQNFPIEVRKEAESMIIKIRNRGIHSLKKSDYTSLSKNKKDKDHYDIDVHFMGLNPAGDEFIVGSAVSAIIQKDYLRNELIRKLKINLYITVQGYMDVQNLIRDGVIIDHKRKLLAVVGIDDILDNDHMTVRVGHQGRDLKITTRPAIIERIGSPKKKKWKLVMWL